MTGVEEKVFGPRYGYASFFGPRHTGRIGYHQSQFDGDVVGRVMIYLGSQVGKLAGLIDSTLAAGGEYLG